MKYSYMVHSYIASNKDLDQFSEQVFTSYHEAVWALIDAGFCVLTEDQTTPDVMRKIIISCHGFNHEGISIGALPNIYLYY